MFGDVCNVDVVCSVVGVCAAADPAVAAVSAAAAAANRTRLMRGLMSCLRFWATAAGRLGGPYFLGLGPRRTAGRSEVPHAGDEQGEASDAQPDEAEGGGAGP